MYYLLQLEEAGKIRNSKSVPLTATKTMFPISELHGKSSGELTCQDVRDFLWSESDHPQPL